MGQISQNDLAVVQITVETPTRQKYLLESQYRLSVSNILNNVTTVSHKPGERTATGNVAEALRVGASKGKKWVLFLEDDIDVCDRFYQSVANWLDAHASNQYRVYSFSVPHQAMNACAGQAWAYPIERFCCTQAFAIRSEDALSLSQWLVEHPSFTGPDGNTSTGAYDLAMRAWAKATWPTLNFFLASNPSFVQHMGADSALTPGRDTITMPTWPGRDWSYGATTRKPRLLWVGDGACPSGFARSTHGVLETLKEHYDVTVLAINYNGDPHPYPYPIYAAMPGGDAFGVGRLVWMCDLVKPDVIVIQQDPWNFPYYLEKLQQFDEYSGIPVVGVVAVDGKNCRGTKLNGLSLAIFWTRFGLEEARKGGYTGPAVVVPLGVDTAQYYPVDRLEARRRLGLDGPLLNWFIIGNVNRNQPRKRLDLMLEYVGEWVKRRQLTDVLVALHVAPTGDKDGIDCKQYAAYCGVLLASIEPPTGYGVPEDELRDTYNAFDACLNTSQGEGFGLTTFEAMACGIPQILPDCAAHGELCKGAALLVPCTSNSITMYGGINSVGGVMDKELAIQALDRVYEDRQLRKELSIAALDRVQEPCFRWEHIGALFFDSMESVLSGVSRVPVNLAFELEVAV